LQPKPDARPLEEAKVVARAKRSERECEVQNEKVSFSSESPAVTRMMERERIRDEEGARRRKIRRSDGKRRRKGTILLKNKKVGTVYRCGHRKDP